MEKIKLGEVQFIRQGMYATESIELVAPCRDGQVEVNMEAVRKQVPTKFYRMLDLMSEVFGVPGTNIITISFGSERTSIEDGRICTLRSSSSPYIIVQEVDTTAIYKPRFNSVLLGAIRGGDILSDRDIKRLKIYEWLARIYGRVVPFSFLELQDVFISQDLETARVLRYGTIPSFIEEEYEEEEHDYDE